MSENILGEGAAKHRVEDLSDVQVDSYERGGHVVGLVLWQGKSPEPFLCLKVSELGRMGRFTLVSNDDVPEHDKHRALLSSRVVLRTAGEGPGAQLNAWRFTRGVRLPRRFRWAWLMASSRRSCQMNRFMSGSAAE